MDFKSLVRLYMTNKSKLNTLFQKSYKKLKSYAYYDKSQLILADKISKFESAGDSNLNAKIEKLTSRFLDDNKREQLLKECLNSIGVLTFPKSINEKDKSDIISNKSAIEPKVEKYQYMIDMSVEAHLLSILWILIYGATFDKMVYDNAYANRIKDHFINTETNEPTFSPYLFQPYFKQYEAWRNNGLKIAKDSHKNNENIIIFSLDLSSYYYSVDFSKYKESYFEMKPERKLIDESLQFELSKYVYQVLERYSSIFSFNKNVSRVMLPIGFLPSNILSNWYLRDFDKSIIDRINPLYYGRYVDDILIVDKAEDESELCKIVENKSSEDLMDYYFCKCKSNTNDLCLSSIFKQNKIDKNKTEYIICDENYNFLKISNEKIKIFYINSSGSASLIDNFIDDISRNISLFNYMVDDNIVTTDINEKVKKIEYSGSVNKIRSIKNMKLDKYEFSKYLAKLSIWGRLVNDPSENKVANDIFHILDNNTIVETYLFWERIFEYFTLNNRLDYLEKFIAMVMQALTQMIPKEKNVSEDFWLEVDTLEETLKKHMIVSLSRVLSLYWSEEIKNITERVSKISKEFSYEYESLKEMRIYFIKSRMSKQSLLPQFIDCYSKLNKDIEKNIDTETINFTTYNFCLNTQTDEIKDTGYKYYPYFIQYKDVLWWKFNLSLVNNNPKIDYDKVHDLFIRLNNGIPLGRKINGGIKSIPIYNSDYYLNDTSVKKFKNEFSIFDDCVNKKEIKLKKGYYPLKSHNCDVIKIAVANVDVDDSQIVDNIKGNPVRTADRWATLSDVVNEAIKNKADMLVLPECYLPIDWLPTLMHVSQKNNMAIISGIEHYIYCDANNTKTAHNLTATILSHKVENRTSCTLFIHSKVHFSPEEKRTLNGYGIDVKEGNEYSLYVWNGIWFPIYCCYELADIHDRALFKSYLDIMIAVEWNKDTNYYSNIIESLSRDMHCFCVQVNTSGYGDSRITQPSKTVTKDILKVKGGKNSTVLIGELNVKKLREFQLKNYELQKDDSSFKPTPPNYDKEIVMKKIRFSRE